MCINIYIYIIWKRRPTAANKKGALISQTDCTDLAHCPRPSSAEAIFYNIYLKVG